MPKTKKITLLTLWATPDRVVQPGTTVEVDKETYDLLIAKGYGHEPDVDVSSPETEAVEGKPPPGNASTQVWADYAVEHCGADPAAVAELSRDELRAEFGPDDDVSSPETEAVEGKPPPGNASTQVWADYAVEHCGADPAAVAELSRDELRAEFGPDDDES